jgi:hypothetical protein
MHLVETGWSSVDWIGLAQDRDKYIALVNAVMSLRVKYNAGKLIKWLHNQLPPK